MWNGNIKKQAIITKILTKIKMKYENKSYFKNNKQHTNNTKTTHGQYE